MIADNDSVKISESCGFDTLFLKQDQNGSINFAHKINVFQNKIKSYDTDKRCYSSWQKQKS